MYAISSILAKQIRISEVLAWDINTYLTHVTQPRLLHVCECCTLVVLEITLSSSDVIDMSK